MEIERRSGRKRIEKYYARETVRDVRKVIQPKVK